MKDDSSPHSGPAMAHDVAPLYTGQLEFDFSGLTLPELRLLLSCGLVCAVGATPAVGSRIVTSYALTPAGRAILGNQLAHQKRILRA